MTNQTSRKDFLKALAGGGALLATAGLPSLANDDPRVFPQRGQHERLLVSYIRIDAGATKPFSVFHISDTHGKGVRFSAVGAPLFVQALHYTWEDLEFARHRATQLRYGNLPSPRPEVCLNLDLRQCGLGNGSCGRNPPLAMYRFVTVPERWTLVIECLR